MQTDSYQWTPERMQRTFQAAEQSKPAYKAMLPFFENLFALQEAAVQNTHPAPIRLDSKLLAAKRKGELPLLDRRTITIDWPAAIQLLRKICEIAHGTNVKLSVTADKLVSISYTPGDRLEKGFMLLLNDDTNGIAAMAESINVSWEAMAFLLYSSLWPSLARHAHRLQTELPPQGHWQKGYCPVCGSQPALSILAQEGQRYLVCGFCRHQWAVRRIFCPFCENEDASTLGYFFAADEKEYRVNTCQNCHKYIKTIDIRQMTRPFYAPLEAILTTHMDMQAEQAGFRSMTPVWLSL